MRIKLQLMFIFLCLGALDAYGQGIGDRNRITGRGTYRITGKVYLPDGSPAKNLSVTASGSEVDNGSTRTDLDGVYTFSGLSSGNYTVSVREKGYRTETETLTIPEGVVSGQPFTIFFYLRTTSAASANPLLKDIPKGPLAKFEKGMEKMGSGDFTAAVPLFQEAIALYPQFAAAYFERGSAYLKLNDNDKALESFVKAIEIKPDYVEAKYWFGYTHYIKKNYEVAADIFDDVLKQKAEMPEASMYLGISLFNLKNVDGAEASLKKALAAKGGEKLALAHLYLGQIYAQKKKNAEAVVELEKYLELLPKAPNAEKIKSAIADLKK
ncbi:MAG: tetratricopeptide repeat protein [Pyrinomonadaceae bacterium]